MSWIRLDDGYLDHPKFRRLVKVGGPDALYLWHGAIAWCAQHLTDGIISADMQDEPRGPTTRKARQKAWDALVQCRLCERKECEQSANVAGGARVHYVLHDYLKYQPSAVEVRKGRENAARRKQESRNRKLEAESQCDRYEARRDGHASVTAPRARDPDPHPDPDPDPSQGEVVLDASGAVIPLRRSARFAPVDFEPTERQRVRCQELRIDVEALVRDFKNHEFNRDYSDWERRFSRWIEDERVKREKAAAKPSGLPSLRRTEGAVELDTTGAATAFRLADVHRAFAAEHGRDVEWAASEYRRGATARRLDTFEQERDFMARLRHWVASGTFTAEGPLGARKPRALQRI